jgi:hypothetical protein
MFISSKYIVGSLFLMAASVNSQDTAACFAQTAVINQDSGLESAVQAYNAAYAAQVETCIEEMQESCSIDLSAEQQTVQNACTNAEGRNYDPELFVSCDNSNTRTTTTFVTGYMSCVSTNCTTANLEAEANEYLANVTAGINAITSPQGVSCTASFSGAAAMFSMAAASIAAVMVGTVMIMSM